MAPAAARKRSTTLAMLCWWTFCKQEAGAEVGRDLPKVAVRSHQGPVQGYAARQRRLGASRAAADAQCGRLLRARRGKRGVRSGF